MTASDEGRRLEMSFGGCGFLGVYHAGVGKCVVDHNPHLFEKFRAFYGASAGALTAVSAACMSDPMVAYKWVKKTFEASRKFHLGMMNPKFDLYSRLRKFLEGFLPKNAHRLCRGRVKISLTLFPSLKNWIVSDFNTRKELISAIIASSFIPGYSGFNNLPKFRGKRCFDGGCSCNVPHVDDPDVITVSPFSGSCDICPQDSPSPHLIQLASQPMQLSSANLLRLLHALNPTSWAELETLFYQGYEDALKFFRLEGLMACPPPMETKTQSEVQFAQPLETDDTTSEYFSLDGSSTLSLCRSRRHSIALSADFVSCLGDDDDNNEPLTMGALSEEGEEEEEDEGCSSVAIEEDLDEAQRSSSGGGMISKSWRGLAWMMQSCRPSNVPLVRRLYSSEEESSWERELCGEEEAGILAGVVTSWPSSMMAC